MVGLNASWECNQCILNVEMQPCGRVMAGLCLACSLFGLVLVPKKAAPATADSGSSSSTATAAAAPTFNFAILKDSSFIMVALGRQLQVM